MRTQLEQHLYLRQYELRKMLNALNKSRSARRFTADELTVFLDTLNFLLQEIDAITRLVSDVKRSIKDSEEVKRVLLGPTSNGHNNGNGNGNGNGYSQPSHLIQLTLPEYAITEQLMKVQKSRSGKMTRLSVRVERYNGVLRELVIYREQSKRARRMDMIGYPTFSDTNLEIDLRLIDDFYEEILNPYPWDEVIDMQRPIDEQV